MRIKSVLLALAIIGTGVAQNREHATEGVLQIMDGPDRFGRVAVCPLKHTDVQADISGFLARVNVTQEFQNPTSRNIEAVYVFPLPHKAAVDSMTMYIGDRVVKASIKRREEAQRIFNQARTQGQTAALLDQERPNIFTQSVTNIGPGMRVKIVISYVETLPYDDGTYEFSFPMVVGPRYIPYSVDDANRITPPVTKQGTRAGHDISLRVNLDAGIPVTNIESTSHDVVTMRSGNARASVQLRELATIPNKDFILRYDVAGKIVQDAFLTHRDARGGFFTFFLQPPDRVTPAEAMPKEIVFVVDTSGSMQGFPMEKSKEVIKLALDGLHPRDTFNLITFSGDTHLLFPGPVPATPENVQKAQRFLLSRSGSGGTEMMRAIRTALAPSDQQDHIRVVCFMTDGYVGNDMEIIAEVKRHPNARVFSFGIGSSVNRFLLDKMAEEGRGEVQYVTLTDNGSAAAKRFYERVRTPILTDITIDWAGLPVSDVYPLRLPDLFDAKPLIITGRYLTASQGTLRLRGRMAGRPYEKLIRVELPGSQPSHDVLATLWARTRVDNLMSQDWNGMQSRNPRPELREQITKLGLDFRLMTQFTSFIAVEERTTVDGGRPVRIEVPVEIPSGVSYAADAREVDSIGKMYMAAPGAGMGFGRGGRVAENIGVEASVAPSVPTTPAPRADLATNTKLDPTLQRQLVSTPTGAKIQIKIWLNDDSATVIEQLKKAGAEIRSIATGKIVYASIDAAKLADLTQLNAVFFISQDLGQPK